MTIFMLASLVGCHDGTVEENPEVESYPNEIVSENNKTIQKTPE